MIKLQNIRTMLRPRLEVSFLVPLMNQNEYLALQETFFFRKYTPPLHGNN